MPTSHRALIRHDAPDGAWLVEFPSLPECRTYRETLDEGRAHAREALQVWLGEDDVVVVVEEDVQSGAAAS